MKIEIRIACIGAAMLVGMAWMPDAHAQRSPWWERHKEAQTTPEAGTSQSTAQGDAAQPIAQQHQQHASTVRRQQIEGPGYTWFEAGAGRMDVDVYDVSESGNGGYVRGSLAVTDNLYVFGGYDRVAESGSTGAQYAKVTIDQTELGLGTSISLSPRADFISELSLLRLGGELDYKDRDVPEDDVNVSDYMYAGKLMLGVRARPVSSLELWAKAGYLRVEDDMLIEDSMVGNVGIQYRFTPTWGLVGEAEFYEDVRFYRLGVRASF